MNFYFIAILMIFTLNLGAVIAQNGKPRQGRYSFGTTFVEALIFTWLIYMAIVTGF